MRIPTPTPRILLGFGVIAVTSSSFIIKYAEKNIGNNYNPYVLAFTRVFCTGLISVILLGRINKTEKKIERNDIYRIFLAGFSLATHFGWWFDSLYYDIPIGVSLSLTNTAPIWLTLMLFVSYKSIPTKRQMIAIILVIIGSFVLLTENFEMAERQFTGLLLALASAIGFAVYLLIAKDMVPKLGLWRYFGLVNITAAVVLLPWVYIINKEATLYQLDIWLWGIGLALLPGICGHAVYNFAMSKVPPIDVGISTLGEPILGTLLAWLIFSQFLSYYQIVGISILIIAIGFTIEFQQENTTHLEDQP